MNAQEKITAEFEKANPEADIETLATEAAENSIDSIVDEVSGVNYSNVFEYLDTEEGEKLFCKFYSASLYALISN